MTVNTASGFFFDRKGKEKMNRKQYGLMVIVALIGGLMGGLISSHFLPISSVLAEKKSEPAKVIEANEFRLIDKYGNHIASLKAEDDPLAENQNIKRQKPALEMNAGFRKSRLTSDNLRIELSAKTHSSLEGGSLKLSHRDSYILLTSSGIKGPGLRISD